MLFLFLQLGWIILQKCSCSCASALVQEDLTDDPHSSYLPWRTGGCPYWVSIFLPESIYLGEQVGVHIGSPYLYQRVFTLENRWVSILGVHIYTREYLPWRTGGCPYWVSILIPESIYLGEQVGVHIGCPYLYQRVFTLENWWVSKFSVRRWVSILTLENRWVSIYSVFTINGVLTGGCPYLHSEQMGVYMYICTGEQVGVLVCNSGQVGVHVSLWN